MPRVRDAYQTTTGAIAVRDDEKFSLWILKEEWLDDSMTVEEQFDTAIELFSDGMMEAFEKYDANHHGLLKA